MEALQLTPTTISLGRCLSENIPPLYALVQKCDCFHCEITQKGYVALGATFVAFLLIGWMLGGLLPKGRKDDGKPEQ